MADMDRDQLLAHVYRRLADGKLGAKMTARAEDGSKPVVVALASDSFSSLLTNVSAAGGYANVAASVLDGLIVFSLRVEEADDDGDNTDPATMLDPGCTVGVLVARMIQDRGLTHAYRCPNLGSHGAAGGRATTTGGSLVEA